MPSLKKKTELKFDTVKFFRAVKEKNAQKTQGMSFLELKAYLAQRKLKRSNRENSPA